MLQGSSVTDSHENDGGPEFAEVFVIYWLGATVVTLNIKLLGGSMYVYSIYGVSFCHAVLCISSKHGLCHCAVCLFVMFMYSVEMNKRIFRIFSPSGSHTILFFPYQTLWQYSNRDPPNGGIELMQLG